MGFDEHLHGFSSPRDEAEAQSRIFEGQPVGDHPAYGEATCPYEFDRDRGIERRVPVCGDEFDLVVPKFVEGEGKVSARFG